MDNKALIDGLGDVFDDFYASDMLIQHLTDSIQYSLQSGGKRIRPLFLLETVQAFGMNITRDHFKVAAAVELIHTSSLIHDDLPAMDNDDYRRGKLTNHKVYGEAQAILAGDALLLDPYLLLTNTNLPAATIVSLVKELAYASGSFGMVAGQVLDMDGEKHQLSLTALQQIHALKTGRILTFPFVAAGIITDQSEAVVNLLRSLGQKVGLAFQIRDDILDVTATFEEIGKTPGKDSVSEKSTYVTLLGLEGAQTELSEVLDDARDILMMISAQTEIASETILKQIERLRID